MDRFGRVIDALIDGIVGGMSARNLPFFTLVLLLGLVGATFSRMVWTSERANDPSKSRAQRLYWRTMRDTQILHMPILGAILMGLWRDPMDYGWAVRDDLFYGALAGTMSHVVWVTAKVWSRRKLDIDIEKQMGIDLVSDPPKSGPKSKPLPKPPKVPAELEVSEDVDPLEDSDTKL